jgi:hypothetical protein
MNVEAEACEPQKIGSTFLNVLRPDKLYSYAFLKKERGDSNDSNHVATEQATSCICWIEPGNPSKADGCPNKSLS